MIKRQVLCGASRRSTSTRVNAADVLLSGSTSDVFHQPLVSSLIFGCHKVFGATISY